MSNSAASTACHLLEKEIRCLQNDNHNYSQIAMCPRIWEMTVCFPSVPYGEKSFGSCSNIKDIVPDGVSINSEHQLEMICNVTLQDWDSNISPSIAECTQGEVTQEPIVTTQVDTVLRQIVNIEYLFSMVSIITALGIFFMLKKLHCARIFIHFNMLLSFLLRAVVWLIHDAVLANNETSNYNTIESTTSANHSEEVADQLWPVIMQPTRYQHLPQLINLHTKYCPTKDVGWCRFYYILLEYATTANYYWLLAEGLYLWSILHAFSVSSTKKYIVRFLFLGWVMPWINLIVYVVLRSSSEGLYKTCWFEDDTDHYQLILQVPILITLLINFTIFTRLILVVAAKLKFDRQTSVNKKRKRN